MMVRSAGLLVCLMTASAVAAGPVTVRQWVTPKPGQTPLGPSVNMLPDAALDLPAGGTGVLFGFHPSPDWIAPDPAHDPDGSTFVSRRYLFTYTAEVTDPAGGQSRVFTLDGEARAAWIQRYDGLILTDELTVEFAPPGDDWTPVGGHRYRLGVRADRSGSSAWADVTLTSAPTATPEPGTLALALGGLAVAGGVWRRKQRRAALTPGQLPR